VQQRTPDERAARVADALRFTIQHRPDDTIVMVGHDSSNRVLLLQALDLPQHYRVIRTCHLSYVAGCGRCTGPYARSRPMQ